MASLAGSLADAQATGERVAAVIELLIARDSVPPSLAEAARTVRLPPSCLCHCFAAETGTTLRAYAL